MTGTWSLERRFTSWLALVVAGLALLLVVPAPIFLRASLDRELDSLMIEELAELEKELQLSGSGPELLEDIAAELAVEHAPMRLAWALWADGRLVARAGPGALLDQAAVDKERLEETVEATDDIYWRVHSFADGERAAVVVDGAPRGRVLRHYLLVVAGLFAVGAASILTAGALLARRASRVLARVAAEARGAVEQVEGPEAPLALGGDGLPLEIIDVVEAIRGSLGRLRDETRQFRLMTAALAHELRSPIQNLAGELEVALLRDREPAEYRRVLESNLEEVRDLGDAVHNLMILCAAGGIGQGDIEVFDLGEEAEFCLAGERCQASRRSVSLEVEARGDLHLRADREAVLRALRNLVANAVSWSPSPGVVRVLLDGEGDAVRLVVEDQGPGVPPEVREDVFRPFVRGPDRGGQRAGYGLGLAIVQGAVSAQGGEVRILEAEGGGARFEVTFPRQRP